MKKNFFVEQGLLKESVDGKRYKVCIISPGQGSSGIYTEQNLAESAHLFEPGVQVYINHITPMENPERDLRNLAGKIVTQAWQEADGSLWAEIEVYQSFQQLIVEKWQDIGLSINAWSERPLSSEGVVPVFDGVRSVDFVTVAGARGHLAEVLESAAEAPQEEKEEEMSAELAKAIEALTETVTRNCELMESIIKDKETAPEPEPVVNKDEPEEDKVDVDKLIEEIAKVAAEALPDAAKERAIDAVKAGTSAEEAIKREREYMADLKESAGQVAKESANDEEYKVTFWAKESK